ncbi:MAG TPA: hypothetical protein VFD74_01835 [Thermoleophilia bacterium]|nr:hypothetical protein [Thermoleophilia bacterium]
MTDRVGSRTVLLVPLARPPVQSGQPIRLLLEHVCPQDIGEEVVIAIPATLVIEGNNEQVAALQALEHPWAMLLPGDGVAERTAQRVENGGLQQEVARALRLALKNLFDQVVQHETVAAGEGLNEAGGVRSPL